MRVALIIIILILICNRLHRRPLRSPPPLPLPLRPRLRLRHRISLHTHHLKRARQHIPTNRPHQPVIRAQPTEHCPPLEEIQAPHPLVERTPGHTVSAGAIVPVRLDDDAFLCAREHVVVVCGGKVVQIAADVVDDLPAGDADPAVARDNFDRPGELFGDDANGGDAREGGWFQAAVGPGDVGGVSGALTVVRGKEHVPFEVGAGVIVGGWAE